MQNAETQDEGARGAINTEQSNRRPLNPGEEAAKDIIDTQRDTKHKSEDHDEEAEEVVAS